MGFFAVMEHCDGLKKNIFKMDVRLSVKVGDLVKRKGNDWIALVIEMKESSGYTYPRFIILDSGEIQSCSQTLMEVISEAS